MTVNEELKERIYRDYYGKVHGYLLSKTCDEMQAEDIAADVFVKVFARLESYDETRSSLSTWIYTITSNTLTDYYRTRRVHEEIPEELAADDDGPEELLVNGEMLEILADALESLDERSRKIIILKYYSGLTMREVAFKLGISYAYVRLLEKKALSAMKKFFAD